MSVSVPLWNIANVLTVLRILLVPAFAAALLVDGGGSVGWRLVAAGLFTVAALTDRLDGWLARRWELVTTFGVIADPIADKLLIGSALVLLSWMGEIWWWVTVVILVREVGVTVLRFAVLHTEAVPASGGGKLKTVVQTCGVGLFVLPLHEVPAARVGAAVVLGAALVLTVLTGVQYVRAMGRLRSRVVR